MSRGEYPHIEGSNNLFFNDNDENSENFTFSDENDNSDDFEIYITSNIEETRRNIDMLIDTFIRETGFNPQNTYQLTEEEDARFNLQRYDFDQELINAYNYRIFSHENLELLAKLRLFHRQLSMIGDWLNGIDFNIRIFNSIDTRQVYNPFSSFESRMSITEMAIEDLFEELPRDELENESINSPIIRNEDVINSEFTDIDFRDNEFVSVKYFFLPPRDIIRRHPNIIVYQMNIIVTLIYEILIRIDKYYPNVRPFKGDLSEIPNYRFTHPERNEHENIEITHRNEYLQLYVLLAMYRYLVTYDGQHISRRRFLEYMYQVEGLLFTDNINTMRNRVVHYIKMFKKRYFQEYLNYNN